MATVNDKIVSGLPYETVLSIVRRLCLGSGNFTEKDGVFSIKESQNGWNGFGVAAGLDGGFATYSSTSYWPASVLITVQKDGIVNAQTHVYGLGPNTTHCEAVAGKIKAGLLVAFQDYKEKQAAAKAASSQAAQPQQSIPEQIMAYKQLLDQGIITPEEFAAKKKELLKLP
jgi:hypothetical protein